LLATESVFSPNIQQKKSARIDRQYFQMNPKESTKKGVKDSTGISDEDICDQDSVASSVDSTAEEMFMDGLDSVLDR